MAFSLSGLFGGIKSIGSKLLDVASVMPGQVGAGASLAKNTISGVTSGISQLGDAATAHSGTPQVAQQQPQGQQGASPQQPQDAVSGIAGIAKNVAQSMPQTPAKSADAQEQAAEEIAKKYL